MFMENSQHGQIITLSQFWDSQTENSFIATVYCFIHLKTQILLFPVSFMMNMQYIVLDSFIKNVEYFYVVVLLCI